MYFYLKKKGPKLPVLKVYEAWLCLVQKISTRYKSTFFLLHAARQAGISKSRKVQFLWTMSMSDLGPRKCNFHRQNAPFESARGTGEGGRKRGIAAVGRVWQQQGEHGLVGHVPRYRMVRFEGHPRQVEGAGRDTVKNL